jgi:hypothetical protein
MASKGFTVLTLDFFGSGQSDLVCSDDGLAFYVDRVVDVVEMLGFTKPFILGYRLAIWRLCAAERPLGPLWQCIWLPISPKKCRVLFSYRPVSVDRPYRG